MPSLWKPAAGSLSPQLQHQRRRPHFPHQSGGVTRRRLRAVSRAEEVNGAPVGLPQLDDMGAQGGRERRHIILAGTQRLGYRQGWSVGLRAHTQEAASRGRGAGVEGCRPPAQQHPCREHHPGCEAQHPWEPAQQHPCRQLARPTRTSETGRETQHATRSAPQPPWRERGPTATTLGRRAGMSKRVTAVGPQFGRAKNTLHVGTTTRGPGGERNDPPITPAPLPLPELTPSDNGLALTGRYIGYSLPPASNLPK